MPTQIQIRGAVAGTQNARTLATREPDVDTTNERLAVHNGSRAGGMPHVNARDALNQQYSYAAASGTDAITATYNFAPTAWQAGMSGKFKAANTNTTSATFNPNGIGAKTFKKIQDGALVTLEAGDIVQDMIHEWDYNGTDLILLNPANAGAAGGVVATETASASASLQFNSVFTAGNSYEIELINVVPAVDGRDVGIEFTANNGSSYLGTSHQGLSVSAGSAAGYSGDAGYVYRTTSGVGSASGEYGVSGFLNVFNPGGSETTPFSYDFVFADSNGLPVVNRGGGFYGIATALTGFRVRIAPLSDIESGQVIVREKPLS